MFEGWSVGMGARSSGDCQVERPGEVLAGAENAQLL